MFAEDFFLSNFFFTKLYYFPGERYLQKHLEKIEHADFFFDQIFFVHEKKSRTLIEKPVFIFFIPVTHLHVGGWVRGLKMKLTMISF